MREKLAGALKNTLNNFRGWAQDKLDRRYELKRMVTEPAKDTVELKFQIARALRAKDVTKFEELALKEELKRGSREFGNILNSVTNDKKIDTSFIPQNSIAAIIVEEAANVQIHHDKITKLKEEIDHLDWLAMRIS